MIGKILYFVSFFVYIWLLCDSLRQQRYSDDSISQAARNFIDKHEREAEIRERFDQESA